MRKNIVIFITGIDKIYLIVRARDILNNLNITDVPLVVLSWKIHWKKSETFNEIDDTNIIDY